MEQAMGAVGEGRWLALLAMLRSAGSGWKNPRNGGGGGIYETVEY